MSKHAGPDELKTEINRGNFTRAAFLAKSQGLSEKEVVRLRYKALWLMAAVHRNAPGTKKLAREYGLSKNELKEFLENTAEKRRKDGQNHIFGMCYSSTMGCCLIFDEWMNHFFEKFERI